MEGKQMIMVLSPSKEVTKKPAGPAAPKAKPAPKAVTGEGQSDGGKAEAGVESEEASVAPVAEAAPAPVAEAPAAPSDDAPAA
jgi:hypothetical protein